MEKHEKLRRRKPEVIPPFWRSTPSLCALLAFTQAILFVPSFVMTVWEPLQLWSEAGAANGHESQQNDTTAYKDVIYMLLWHVVLAPAVVWLGPTLSIATFALTLGVLAAAPLLFLHHPLARTMYGCAGLVIIGGRVGHLRRGVYPTREIRDSFLARLVFCSWYQDLSAATLVGGEQADRNGRGSRKESTAAAMDAQIRTILLRFALVAGIAPAMTWGVLLFASDRPFYADLRVFFFSTVPRVFCCGMLFSQTLEVLDTAYTVPLLLLPDPVKASVAMRHPFAAASLGEFWAKRWNTAIQNILYNAIHIPVKEATHSSGVAALATFSSSALLHVYGFAIAGASMTVS